MNKNLCVFDLDGTLDLTQANLYMELFRLNKNLFEFVVATGRTNEYVMEACRKHSIFPPKFIIADNGGTVFDNRRGEFLRKTSLSSMTRRCILQEYMKLGGRIEEVRYTDGEKVYAVQDRNVKEYYKKENIIDYKTEEELINAILAEETDITKITLAGSKKVINDLMRFIEAEGIECWSDIGATKFPIRIRRNYRLDVMDKASSKGEAIDFLIEHTGITNFTCIGNGLNDLSMFKLAIDRGMPIVVVRNFEGGKPSKESEELIRIIEEYIEGKALKGINVQGLLTVRDFPVNKYLMELERSKGAKEKREKFVKSMKVMTRSQITKSPNINHRVQERGR